MGLQVRLRHALGERVLDLPERGVDHPIFVGRATDADVQVPSIHVGLQHLVFFVHDGQWAVQGVPGNTGTSINGVALSGARRLLPGDMLTLGNDADAPTIQIGQATVAAPPATAYAPPAEAAYDASAYAPETGFETAAAADDTAAVVDWAPAPSAVRPRPRRPRKSSDAAVAFAVVVSLAIVVGAGVFRLPAHAEAGRAAARRRRARAPAADAARAAPADAARRPEHVRRRLGKAAPGAAVKRPPPPADVTDAQPPIVEVRAVRRCGAVGGGRRAWGLGLRAGLERAG
jgi:hypothetical protein